MDSPEAHAAPESRLHFLDYWRIIRIRKAIILSVFLITTIIAILVTILMKPAYASTATIEIQPDVVSDAPTFNGGQGSYAPYDAYFMETELKTIQGQTVLNNVIDTLHLNEEWGKKMNPDGRPLKPNDTLGILRRYLSLDVDRNTKLIDINVVNEDRDMAARIANAVADSYKQYRFDQYQQRMEAGVQKLRDGYAAEETNIMLMQSNVDNLRVELNINDTGVDSSTSTTISKEQMQHYSELLIEGKATYMKLESQMTELQNIQATNPMMLRDVLPTTQSDAELSDLLSKLHDAQQRFVAEQNFAGKGNPDFVNLQATIAELNREIDARVQGIMVGFSSNIKSQKAALDALNQQVQEAEANDAEEAVRGQPYWRAKRDLQERLNLHQMLAAKIESDQADASIPKTALVMVVNSATPGDIPVRPQKTLQICLGAFFGLLVGVALAFFIEYLDTSVKTIDEVERVFQAPVLGVIPQNVGSLMDEGVDSSHAEAYRVLRTNILFSRKAENLNTLVVVSAGMGEGKSTTVLNLATVFAQAGQRTLVVDSDLRRPTLHKLLHLSNNLGLVNYLLKQNTLEQVIQTTPVQGLDFLASGKLPSGNMNILGSAVMKALINDLKQRYDFILFDSPPIMGLSDASVLASEVDLAIQIIQYRRYPQLMNIRAKQMVEKVGGNLVGIVLNNINMAQDESYYYYGGYYHNSEESTEEPAAKNASDDDDDSPGGAGRGGIEQKY